MQKSRLIAIGFLVVCGLIIAAVSQGWIGSGAPLAVFPTAAPAPTATLDPADAVTIEIIYSTEKEQWLKAMVERWKASGPTVDGRPIEVVLRGLGSQSIVSGLQDGSLRPSAIIPASTLQITELNAALIDGKQGVAKDSASLLLTPLVVVAWQPEGPSDPVANLKGDATLWRTIQTQVQSQKRDFLFGQTSPLSSNSGLQTFALMAYAYHNKSSGLTAADIADPGFTEWLGSYVKHVEKFGESTGTFMDDMVRFGPSRYDAVAVYESTALDRIETAKNRWGPLHLIYPPANLWSDHPFALLDAAWVSADQRAAAGQLREFLLAREQQQAAVSDGFRPSDPDVPINGADSPFVKYRDYGVQQSITTLVADPAPEVIAGLLDLWRKLEPSVRR